MPDINLNQLREVARQQQNADFTVDTKTGDLRIDSRQNPFQRAISWVREKFTSEATLKMERHGAYNLFLRAMSQHSGFNDADVARVAEKISAAVIGNKPLSARNIIQILSEVEAEQSSPQAKKSPEERKPLEARKSSEASKSSQARKPSEASVPKDTPSYADILAKVQAKRQEDKPIEDQVEELATLPKREKRTRFTPTEEQKDFSFEKDRATNYAKARSAEAEKQVQEAVVTPKSQTDTPVKTSEGAPLAFQNVFGDDGVGNDVGGEPEKINASDLDKVLKTLNLPQPVRTEIEGAFKSAGSIDKYDFALIANEKLSEWVVGSRSDSWYKEALKESKDPAAIKASKRNDPAPDGFQDRLLSVIQNHDQALSYHNAKIIGKQAAKEYVKAEFHLN